MPGTRNRQLQLFQTLLTQQMKAPTPRVLQSVDCISSGNGMFWLSAGQRNSDRRQIHGCVAKLAASVTAKFTVTEVPASLKHTTKSLLHSYVQAHQSDSRISFFFVPTVTEWSIVTRR
jgi:hypothetical protein